MNGMVCKWSHAYVAKTKTQHPVSHHTREQTVVATTKTYEWKNTRNIPQRYMTVATCPHQKTGLAQHKNATHTKGNTRIQRKKTKKHERDLAKP